MENSPRMLAESSSVIQQLHPESLGSAGALGSFQQVELVPARCWNGRMLEWQCAGVPGSMQYALSMDENSVVFMPNLRDLCMPMF